MGVVAVETRPDVSAQCQSGESRKVRLSFRVGAGRLISVVATEAATTIGGALGKGARHFGSAGHLTAYVGAGLSVEFTRGERVNRFYSRLSS